MPLVLSRPDMSPGRRGERFLGERNRNASITDRVDAGIT